MAVSPAPLLLPLNDDQLLRRSLAGDRDARIELFRRYRLIAYRVAFRLLGREADALATVQEGFVQALTSEPGCGGQTSFKARLLGLVSRAALDRARQPLGPAAPARENDFPAPPRPSLGQALARLPEALRQITVLHAEGELSYREVGEVLSLSRRAVRSQLADARQRLLACLPRPPAGGRACGDASAHRAAP